MTDFNKALQDSGYLNTEKPIDDRSEFRKGATGALMNTIAGGKALIGAATNDPRMQNEAINDMARYGSENQANVGAIEDINGFGEFTDWLTYNLGSGSASIATMVAGGGIPGMAAKGLVRLGAGKATKSVLQATGAGLAGFAPNYGESLNNAYQETGEIKSTAAFAAAGIKTALDVFTPLRVLKASGKADLADGITNNIKMKLVNDNRFKSAMIDVAKTMGIEAVTEAAQTYVDQVAANYLTDETNAFGVRDWSELMNSAAAGAAGSMGFGAYGGYQKSNEAQALRMQSEQQNINVDEILNNAPSVEQSLNSGQDVDLTEVTQAQPGTNYEAPAVARQAGVNAPGGSALFGFSDDFVDNASMRQGNQNAQANPMVPMDEAQTWQPNFTLGQEQTGMAMPNTQVNGVAPYTYEGEFVPGREEPQPSVPVGQVIESPIIEGEFENQRALPDRTNVIYGQDGRPQQQSNEQFAGLQQELEQENSNLLPDKGIIFGADERDLKLNSKGKPFKSANAVKANKAYRDAVSAGNTPNIVEVNGGFAWEIDGPTSENRNTTDNEVEQPTVAPVSAKPIGGRKPVTAVSNQQQMNKATTPQGRDIDVEYQVVEADELIASNTDDGKQNPNYPQQLQPRDRTRANSELQINNIANNLKPELLAENPLTSDGAPIISDSGVVESGNGRTLAIRRAYNQDKAEGYRGYLKTKGFDTTGMKKPVLVRVRKTQMSEQELQEYTKESNERTTLSMSSSEQAKADTKLIDPIIDDYVGGDLIGAANRTFVRKFMTGVSSADQASMVNSKGELSQDGQKRIQAAIVSKAYGDETLVSEMFESTDSDMKSIGGALLDIAGSWSKMRSKVEGEIDITDKLIEAVNKVRQARAEGRSIKELVNQDDMFAGEVSPLVSDLINVFYNDDGKARSKKAVSQALASYSDIASNTQTGEGLFGDDLEQANAKDILEQANEQNKQNDDQSKSQTGLFDGAQDAGQSNGTTRERPGQQKPKTPKRENSQDVAKPTSKTKDDAFVPLISFFEQHTSGTRWSDRIWSKFHELSDKALSQGEKNILTQMFSKNDKTSSIIINSIQDKAIPYVKSIQANTGKKSSTSKPAASSTTKQPLGRAENKWALGRKLMTELGVKPKDYDRLFDLFASDFSGMMPLWAGNLYEAMNQSGPISKDQRKEAIKAFWVNEGVNPVSIDQYLRDYKSDAGKLEGGALKRYEAAKEKARKILEGKGPTGPGNKSKLDATATKLGDKKAAAAAALATLIKSKKGTLNSGFDPEVMIAIAKVGGYTVAEGTVKFAQWVRDVLGFTRSAGINDADVTPYLKEAYGAISYNPEKYDVSEEMADTMESPRVVSKIDIETLTKESDNDVSNTSETVEQVSESQDQEQEPANTDATQSNGSEQGPGQTESNAQSNLRPNSEPGVSTNDGSMLGEGGIVDLFDDTGAVRNDSQTSDTRNGGRGNRNANTGTQAEQPAAPATDSAVKQLKPKETEAQTKKNKTHSAKFGDKADILKSVPVLLDEQAGDIALIEDRFFGTENPGPGYQNTNGTGTGKTFVGLGAAKRFVQAGKENILIVVPNDGIAQQWVAAGADFFGLDLYLMGRDSKTKLRDPGKGITIATYSTLGKNNALINERDKFDLIIADESQNMMGNAQSKDTNALKQFRALTNHENGRYHRAKAVFSDEQTALDEKISAKRYELMQRTDTVEQAERDAKDFYKDEQREISDKIRSLTEELGKEGQYDTKALFLSATPWPYVKNLAYSEGFLFNYTDYGDKHEGGYDNAFHGHNNFYIKNFGYRWRYHKLNSPGAEVDQSLMEREFHENLKEKGVLGGRTLEVEADYRRDFVKVETAAGEKLDDLIELFGSHEVEVDGNEFPDHPYRDLADAMREEFDYHSRVKLLEAIKAEEAVERANDHMKMGRKVVIFHSYNVGGSVDPVEMVRRREPVLLKQFEAEFPGATNINFGDLRRPLDVFEAEFGNAVRFYNGTVKDKDRAEAKALFNDDNSEVKVIVVQQEAGEAGISLHDVTGKYQRVLINIGMPVKPTQFIQIEGRTYRVGVKTDAQFENLTTGTAFERGIFATTIAGRASTAENLAMGEFARSLKENISEGYLDADYKPAQTVIGKGGKKSDKPTKIDAWDKAKSYYYSNLKRTQGTKSAEGNDYFATPEPVGLKMVQWAQATPGDRLLEPSVGHAAIGRWFPGTTRNKAVEQSFKLSSMAQMIFAGDVINDTFESLNVINKFEAVIMNPPFGKGGKLAYDHVRKGIKHLVNGGRVVALVPDGPAANKNLNKLLEDPKLSNIYQSAEVDLPQGVFERAGTNVKTKIIILDRFDDAKDAPQMQSVSFNGAKDVNELFDRIKDVELRQRNTPTLKEVDPNQYMDSTAKSKAAGFPVTFFATLPKQVSDIIDEEAINQFNARPTKDGKKWFFDGEEERSDFANAAARIIDEAIESGVEFNFTIPVEATRVDGEKSNDYFEYSGETYTTKKGKEFLVTEMLGRQEYDTYKQLKELAKDNDGWARGQKFMFPTEDDVTQFNEKAKTLIEGSVTENVAFNRSTDKNNKGVSRDEAELITKSFIDFYPGLQDDIILTVVDQKPSEIFNAAQLEPGDDTAIKGGFDKDANRLYIFAQNHSSNEDIRRTLREELLVHKGLGLFKPSQVKELLAAISDTRDSKNKRVREIWADIDKNYAKASPIVQAEEFLGKVAQNKLSNFGRLWNQVVAAMTRLLRKAGLVRGSITIAEMNSIVLSIGGKLKEGKTATKPTSEGSVNLNRKTNSVSDLKANIEGMKGIKTLNLFIDRKGDLKLDTIIVDKDQRKTGIGTQAIQRIVEFADINGMRIKLSPAIKDDFQGTTSQARLVKFYKQFGFIENKGRNKNFEISEGMYREPKHSDIRFNRVMSSAKDKLGLGDQEPASIVDSVKSALGGATMDNIKQGWSNWRERATEGVFDSLYGIKKAEEAAGIDIENQGYVSARLASGVGDVIHAVMFHGAPKWQDGIIQKKEGTKGILEVFGQLDEKQLNDWLSWMAGNRANKLMEEGRENNLTQEEINELMSLNEGREGLFDRIKDEYNQINTATLDLAQEAGLVSSEVRDNFESEYYVPFFRDIEAEDNDISGALFNGKGIQGQSANLKKLKGGQQKTKDILENILLRQSKLIDASMKNKAMLEVADNLDGTGAMERVNLNAIEIQQVYKNKGKTPYVSVVSNGEKIWYQVNEPALLRGLTQLNIVRDDNPWIKMGRAAKRFLTTGVTMSPEFIFRNFIRDSAHGWMINKDKFKFGIDSVKGAAKTWKADKTTLDMMFAGASFQGGYVHATDPEASAQLIRRALRKKGLSSSDINSYLASIPKSLAETVEKYREFSDGMENANRASTYSASMDAGKSKKVAAFEAKDFMDFSLQGNYRAMQTLVDLIPFLNARLQGMYKLKRASINEGDNVFIKRFSKELATKGMMVAGFSLALAALNGEDERYEELQDWDKDANWHFFLGDTHIRIPKPFELGIIFGTMPERMFHLSTGDQTSKDIGKSAAHALLTTMSFNPIPQFIKPALEAYTNYDMFGGRDIDSFGDMRKRPEDRYSMYTTGTAKNLGELFGWSPKRIDHVIRGYGGTLASYILAAADAVANTAATANGSGEFKYNEIDDLSLVRAFVQNGEVGSSYFRQEYYDMLKEVNAVYGQYKIATQEQDQETAQEILKKGAIKLKFRPMFNKAQAQMNKLNQQSNLIWRNKAVPLVERERMMDELSVKKNALAKRIILLYREYGG